MADPDDAPPADPVPTEGAAPAADNVPLPLPKVPRANPPTTAQRRGGAAATGDEEISLEELLNWARTFEGAPDLPAESPVATPKAERSQIAREKRKFRKFDPEAARDEPLPAEAADTPLEDADAWDESEDDSRGGGAVAENPLRGLRRPKEEPRSFMSSLATQGVVLVLMGASFLVGRATVPANVPATIKRPAPVPMDSDKTPTILPAAAMDMIDRAITAENAGEGKKASAIFDQLRHDYGHIEGLDYHLAGLAYHTGDSASAVVLLNRSIAAGEAVGQAYGLRGLIAIQRGSAKNLHDFEAATQADPFDAQNFFYWGEELRRKGKLQEALGHLREAAERAHFPSEQATDALKVRLTQIELGRAKEIDDQIDAKMALPRPPAEWVLTAAARDMQAGNYPAAATDLNMARQLMEPKLLAQALRDYFFLGFADKPALKPVFVQTFPPSGYPAPAASTAAEPPAETPEFLPPDDPMAVFTSLPIPVAPSPSAPP